MIPLMCFIMGELYGPLDPLDRQPEAIRNRFQVPECALADSRQLVGFRVVEVLSQQVCGLVVEQLHDWRKNSLINRGSQPLPLIVYRRINIPEVLT